MCRTSRLASGIGFTAGGFRWGTYSRAGLPEYAKQQGNHSLKHVQRSVCLKVEFEHYNPLKTTVDDDVKCYHCGADCGPDPVQFDGKPFCCRGCRTVYKLLNEKQLCRYYELDSDAGNRPVEDALPERFQYLDLPEVRQKVLSFESHELCRVSFFVPSMHCSACIYLLENLPRLEKGVLKAEADFARRTVHIHYNPQQITLSRLAARLAGLGYEPEIDLQRETRRVEQQEKRLLYARLGVAGFAFGNVMLLSLPHYLAGSQDLSPELFRLFNWLSLVLSLPVLFFSAREFFESAIRGLKERQVSVDLPIALGATALFLQSAWLVAWQRQPGYFDSFTGLIFFLLVGRVFQQKTYSALSFAKSLKDFFPLAVRRLTNDRVELTALEKVKPGDRLEIRHQELIPADGVLLQGVGRVDYAFITGESRVQEVSSGDLLYAGGRQMGPTIIMEIVRAPAQSYLGQLWQSITKNQRAPRGISAVVDRISPWFTAGVLMLATVAAFFWFLTDPSKAISVAVAVLIVACPCALALAAPFAYGTAQRLLAHHGFFLSRPQLIERLAEIKNIVFDKTGTLTFSSNTAAQFVGNPLSINEKRRVAALVRHSVHPLSERIYHSLKLREYPEVEDFLELPGRGLKGRVDGIEVLLGNAAWVGYQESTQEVALPFPAVKVYLSFNGIIRGYFLVLEGKRPGLSQLIPNLREKYSLFLISGDRREAASEWFDLFAKEELHFEVSPQEKRSFIEKLQLGLGPTLMVGDGLNDAAALQSADVGVAVAETNNSYFPESDALLRAEKLNKLPSFLQFSHRTQLVVKAALLLSLLYNGIGLSFAVTGNLTPLVSALLMPTSSIVVVSFSTLLTRWAARRMESTG